MNDKLNSCTPLVSIAMMTYNQKDYVRDALLSILDQSYDNLEIVISTDGTWNRIEAEVEKYLSGIGTHKNIVLNRTQRNLGIVKHFELVVSKCHGELVVCQAGDDISTAQRVKRIVEDWIEDGKQAFAIYHGAWKIDKKGRYMGQLGDFYFTEGTLGAVAAYSPELMAIFGSVSEAGAAEDEVYGNRALMLDRRLNIRENLLKYRINVGVSSGYRDYRRKQIRVLREYKLAAMRQALIDLEKARSIIAPERYGNLRRLFNDRLVDVILWIDLWDNPDLKNRFQAYRKIIRNCSAVRFLIATILLFPRRIGDFALCVLNYLFEIIKMLLWSCRRVSCNCNLHII